MTFILNTTITVCWSLDPTASPLVIGDYDVYVIKPDGSATYTDGGLTSYTAPTATLQGIATYDLSINQIGRWETRLAVGTNLVYVENSAQQVYVIDPPSIFNITTEIPIPPANYDPP